MNHTGPVGEPLDTLDPYSWQPKQQCRTVRHSPWFLPSPERFATLRLQKAKGLLLQRHAHESEITTARLNFKRRYSPSKQTLHALRWPGPESLIGLDTSKEISHQLAPERSVLQQGSRCKLDGGNFDGFEFSGGHATPPK